MKKNFGIGFLIFLRRFISADVREKGGTNEKSAHSPVCIRKSIGSLYLTPLFTAFEKMWRGISTHFFLVFLQFLKSYPLKSEILDWMDRINCTKLPCFSDYDQFFLHKNLWPSEKSNLPLFWPLFSNCLEFLENYLPKSETFVSITRTDCGKLPCMSGYTLFFTEEVMTLATVKFLKFWLVFWNFLTFDKTTIPNLTYWFNCKLSCIRAHAQKLLNDKLSSSEKSNVRFCGRFSFEIFWFSQKLPSQIWYFRFNRKKKLWQAPLIKQLH